VLSNERALPRAYVPHEAQVIADDQQRLEALSSTTFDPRKTAYLERPTDVPSNMAGSVEFVEDTPQRVTLAATMQTAGLVVLADRWDPGWKAYVNNVAVPIWRVNHALRGVRVEPGASEVKFQYEPASLYRGLSISAAGSLVWLVWAGGVVFLRLRRIEWRPLTTETVPATEHLAPLANKGKPKERPTKAKKARRATGGHHSGTGIPSQL
jgi:hypothetical protein